VPCKVSRERSADEIISIPGHTAEAQAIEWQAMKYTQQANRKARAVRGMEKWDSAKQID
jgi:hypothetical protein